MGFAISIIPTLAVNYLSNEERTQECDWCYLFFFSLQLSALFFISPSILMGFMLFHLLPRLLPKCLANVSQSAKNCWLRSAAGGSHRVTFFLLLRQRVILHLRSFVPIDDFSLQSRSFIGEIVLNRSLFFF